MRVGVFLGSSAGKSIGYYDMAHELGHYLANNDIGIVFGGGDVGLMGALAKGAIDSGGEVIGVIPRKLSAIEMPSENVSELIYVDTIEERKTIMFTKSDGFLVLPGGMGTMDEFFSVMTWNILGYQDKPVALLNYQGFYQPLYDVIQYQQELGFIRDKWLERLAVADSIEDAVAWTTGGSF